MNYVYATYYISCPDLWNEAGQLVAAFGNKYCGYYAYDAQGNRAYKITGYVVEDQHNAGYPSYTAYFDDATLYINPYMVVTPQGYTKHYYNGSQRIASQIGRISDLPTDIIDTSAVARERIANAQAYMASILGATTEKIDISTGDIADIDGDELDELQWQCLDTNSIAFRITLHSDTNMLFPALNRDAGSPANVLDIYYYHADHLGSASWITNKEGTPIEYIHYMPYGELWYDWQASSYNERFKFTGKERDTETGYDYFGARYYASALPMWLSVDPLADKYPNISPYAYCAWNPVKYVDPNGKEFINKLATSMQIKKSDSLSEEQKNSMIRTNNNLNTNLMKRDAINIYNVFELFAHGTSQSIMNKLTRITDPNQLNSTLCASSNYLNADNNNSSVFIFYACNTGAGENSIAQQFSIVKEVSGSIVIAPTGAVSIDDKGMEYIKDGGEWNVFYKGVQIDTISGEKGMMTKYVRENLSDIRSFIRKYDLKMIDRD